MSNYQYQAVNINGKNFKGIIEADTLRDARKLLRERQLIPLEIQAISKQNKTTNAKLASADLALLTRQLSTLIAAGIPLDEALLGVSEQSEKSKIKQIILGLRAKILQGYSLLQALSDFPAAFPNLYCATVGAGEQTGRLDLVLEKLADYTEAQQAAKQKILQALIYPLVMIFVSISIVGFLLAFVVPKIIEVFTSSGQTLPLMTQILVNMSDFIRHHGVAILLIIVATAGLFYYLKRIPKLQKKWHQLILHIPFIAYFVKTVNSSRYIHTFAILFNAGVNVVDTMTVASSVLSNSVMKDAFNDAMVKVKEGTDISKALKETRFLSPMTHHLIASGEKSGQLAAMMVRSGNQMDTEIKHIIDTGLTLLEPLIILMMGTVVLFIVLATLLPIFTMEQLVN